MELQTLGLTENKVKHLCKVANTLEYSPLSNILKSYYLTKCRMLTLSGTICLPQRFSKSTIRCPRCCVQYEDGPANCKIQPHKNNKFVKKLLRKNGKGLTRYQDKYLKNLLRKGEVDAHNALVITCGICKRETKEKLTKPVELKTEELTTGESSKSRKKKKKKDRFSGLDKSAVLSATPQNKMFTPLESTPEVKKNIGHKRNLFIKSEQIKRNTEIANKKEIKEKIKQRKGLSNILNDSKSNKRPNALKLFLTSI